MEIARKNGRVTKREWADIPFVKTKTQGKTNGAPC